MKLDLVIPPDFTLVRRQDGYSEFIARDGQTLIVGPLIPFPEDSQYWICCELGSDRPPGTSLHVVRSSVFATASGWPGQLVAAELRRDSAEVVERRVGAFLRFLEYGGAVLVTRAADVPLDLVTLCAQAEPDFGGEVRSLAELWHGFDVQAGGAPSIKTGLKTDTE